MTWSPTPPPTLAETIMILLSCGHLEFEWNVSSPSSPSVHHNFFGIRFWHYFFSNIYRAIVLPFALGFVFGFMCILVLRLETESTMKRSVEIGRSRVAWQRTGSERSDSVAFYAGPVELSPVESDPVASTSHLHDARVQAIESSASETVSPSSTTQSPNSTTLPFSSIYVISLPLRRDRRDQMKRMLDFLALPFTFFDAHDHSSSAVLSRPEMKPHEGYQPTPGEVGCYLSHRAVWELVVRHALESGDQRPALILEDDIDVEMDVVKILGEVLESFEEEGRFRWDMMYVGHCFETEMPQTEQMISVGIDKRVRPGFEPKCTHAYLLPPHGASILLRQLSTLDGPMDLHLLPFFRTGTLVHVSLYPPPVIQLPRTQNEDSDVQPGNWVWARLPEQTLQRSTRKEAGIETTRK